jgi:hypothetical protein
LNQLIDFHEIQHGVHVIEEDFDIKFLSRSLNRSEIADVQVYQVNEKRVPVNVGA